MRLSRGLKESRAAVIEEPAGVGNSGQCCLAHLFVVPLRALRVPALLLLLLACSTQVPAGSAALGDTAALRHTWERASVALCGGDWENYRTLWATGREVELLHPAGRSRVVGSTAVLSLYEDLINSGFRCTYEPVRFDARVSQSGDLAWVSAEGILSDTSPESTRQTTWYTLVFSKRAEIWQLVHAHASALPVLE